MIFAGLLEHSDKRMYGGVFGPGSLLADKQAFRADVTEGWRHRCGQSGDRESPVRAIEVGAEKCHTHMECA